MLFSVAPAKVRQAQVFIVFSPFTEVFCRPITSLPLSEIPVFPLTFKLSTDGNVIHQSPERAGPLIIVSVISVNCKRLLTQAGAVKGCCLLATA